MNTLNPKQRYILMTVVSSMLIMVLCWCLCGCSCESESAITNQNEPQYYVIDDSLE